MKNDTNSARSSRRAASRQSAANIALVILILLMVNYLGFKYYAHKDISSTQFYTLSPKTKDVLRNLPGPVHIITLLIDKQNGSYWDQTQTLLKEYQRVGGKNITLENVDPAYSQPRAVELQNRLHFTATDNLIIFEFKDPHAAADAPAKNHIVKLDELTDPNPTNGQVSGYKGEQQFTSAIVSLVEGKAHKIYFTAGHGEHPAMANTNTGYAYVSQWLKGENLTVDTLNLALTGSVPADAEALIVAGPTAPFNAPEAQAIDRYLAANGKLMVLLDPMMQSGLDDVLRKYELSFDNDVVLTRYMGNTTPEAVISESGFSSHPIVAAFPAAKFNFVFVSARSIHVSPDSSPAPRGQSLMMTGAEAWGWSIKPNISEAELMNFSGRTYDRTTDVPGPVCVAALYDSGMVSDPNTKEQSTGTRVIAVGSSRFLENDAIASQPVALNFFINSVDWLAKKNPTLDINPKMPQTYGISLSPMSQRTVTWTAILFIPAIALGLGLFSWFSRRK